MPALFTNAAQLDVWGWLRGLLSAGISSTAGAVSSAFGPALADPRDFNLDHPAMMFKSALVGAGFCGIVSMAKFLSTSPLPAVKEVTNTVQTTTVGTAPPKVVETVTEKHVEPLPPTAGTGDGSVPKDK